MIEEAQKAYNKAQAALTANPPNWAEYGVAQKELEAALKKLKDDLRGPGADIHRHPGSVGRHRLRRLP